MEKTQDIWGTESDLAVERGTIDTMGDGVKHEKFEQECYTLERIGIADADAERWVGRPIGHYHTVSCAPFHLLDAARIKKIAKAVSRELSYLCARMGTARTRVLLVGLGNADILPDSIGVGVCDRVHPTAAIRREDPALFHRLGCSELTVLCPGVEAKTGVDAQALVRAAARELQVDLVLATDALCTHAYERLAATVQLSDTGIFPGSGLGQRKARIAAQTVGVPVIAIGIPTVESAYAFLLEEGGRRGITDFSDVRARQAYLCPTSLKADLEIGADIVAIAIEDFLGIRFPHQK